MNIQIDWGKRKNDIPFSCGEKILKNILRGWKG